MKNKINPKKIKAIKIVNFFLRIFFYTKKARSSLNLSELKEILVIDPKLIGDIVMLVPFLRVIRSNCPQSKISLVCGSWAKQILLNENLVDKFYILNDKELDSISDFVLNFFHIINLLRKINRYKYDLAIDHRGDLRYIFFMYFCNSKRKVSYSYTGGECLLTDVIAPSDKNSHLVEDKLFLLQTIGFSVIDSMKYPKLTLSKKELDENLSFIRENKLDEKILIGIHPGASISIKQWKEYPNLVKKLCSYSNKFAFFIFEGPDDKKIVDSVILSINKDSYFYRVKKDLRHYIQFVAMCNVVVCNDSGAGHLSAAFGNETFVIFGPVLPEFAAPYGKNNVHVFSDDSLSCKPCFQSYCSNQIKNKCINNIDLDIVFNSITSICCPENYNARFLLKN